MNEEILSRRGRGKSHGITKRAGENLLDTYLENLAAQIEDDLCIAPSSIHEVLIFPLSLVQPARIIEIVRDVNQTVVLPQEQLSDGAYIYRRGTHTISQATLKNPDDSTCEQND